MNYENTKEFAEKMDGRDPLKSFRAQFLFPQINGSDAIYFCGNSLGLQPVTVRDAIQQELDDWAQYGVHGHLQAKNPWYSYHEMFAGPLSRLVGAKPSEVVAMNGLTVNLHLLLMSFYRPNGKRHKIVCEKRAFPSDQYALESQVRYHGFDPSTAIVEVGPRPGNDMILTEDILETIDSGKEEIALVLLGGVNYYTGQCFEMEKITAKAQKLGIPIGFDLAHAVGNIELKLHDWGVDFGAWCSYKYLNSGAGSVAGAYVHERHFANPDLPRLAGWWGHDKEERFLMEPGFKPIPSAEAWQLSNAPIFSMAPHKAALDIFEEAGMEKLCAKRDLLTGYLEYIINEADMGMKIITPSDSNHRGCQLSVLTGENGKSIHDELTRKGVVSDWRNPNVIRVAPVPLYNSFSDVYQFGQILQGTGQ